MNGVRSGWAVPGVMTMVRHRALDVNDSQLAVPIEPALDVALEAPRADLRGTDRSNLVPGLVEFRPPLVLAAAPVCCPNLAKSHLIRSHRSPLLRPESPVFAYGLGLSAFLRGSLLSGRSRFDSWRGHGAKSPAVELVLNGAEATAGRGVLS